MDDGRKCREDWIWVISEVLFLEWVEICLRFMKNDHDLFSTLYTKVSVPAHIYNSISQQNMHKSLIVSKLWLLRSFDSFSN